MYIKAMVQVYADLVRKGKRTLDEIPEKYRADVNIMGPLSRPLRKFLSVSSNKVSLRSKTAEVEIIWDLIT